MRLKGATENTYGIGAKVILFADSSRQYLEQYPTRGYLSSASPVLPFGLGAREFVDSLRVVWPDGRTQTIMGVEADQTLTLHQERAVNDDVSTRSDSIHFRPADPPSSIRHRMKSNIDDFRRQPLLVNAKSFEGPALATADVNGDERKDVFVGGGNGQASVLYLQQQDGSFAFYSQAAFESHRASNDVEALFFDYDGDGHFTPVNYPKSGSLVGGDAKGLATVSTGDGAPLIVATQNNDSLRAFTALRHRGKPVPVRPLDRYAMITLDGGVTRKVELYLGSTYPSQSSRTLWVPPNAEKVLLHGLDSSRRVKVRASDK